MKQTIRTGDKKLMPLTLNAGQWQWGVAGGGDKAYEKILLLLNYSDGRSVTVISTDISENIKALALTHQIQILEKEFEPADGLDLNMLVIATGNHILDEKIASQAKQQGIMLQVGENETLSDFILDRGEKHKQHAAKQIPNRTEFWMGKNSEQKWKSLTTKLIFAFLFMVLGHIIISYLPLPGIGEIIINVKPYFDYHFLFFVLAGFLAQMVDGVLSMGYGVTSATCLMSFGVSPVAMSGAIHTSEIFTTGISGYSHYKFGNVNKKLFRHLVIPGVIGAILGALLLVFLDDKYGKWLMPLVAVYAGFLGLKILIKAFSLQTKNKKIKRIGWLAWIGGFLDSFGGGGWGPIVTSTLIAKGRSPKYTIGSVSLTEFFVTLSSAFTFFVTVGVSHWNIVLGLLIGGGLAAPIAARLAGKLPRKTMMIAVGIMVMVWCTRMIVKSL